MKPLYDELKKKIKHKIGLFRIEILPCCIHFVKNPVYAFMCVYILKDRIRISFSSDKKINSKRVIKFAKIFEAYKDILSVRG